MVTGRAALRRTDAAKKASKASTASWGALVAGTDARLPTPRELQMVALERAFIASTKEAVRARQFRKAAVASTIQTLIEPIDVEIESMHRPARPQQDTGRRLSGGAEIANAFARERSGNEPRDGGPRHRVPL